MKHFKLKFSKLPKFSLCPLLFQVMLTHLLIQKNQRYFDLMSNFEFGIELFVFYFGALFLVLLTLSVLIRQHRRIRQDKREPAQTSSFLNYFRWSVNCFFIDQYSFSSVGLFLTFAQLYFWLIQLFLANNIKTNKVVGIFVHSKVFDELFKALKLKL